VRNFSEVNFVLKLHPSEDRRFYQDLIEKKLASSAHRVRIITQEYIWDVLNATDIELKRSCTTAIESWLLGKPTIEMHLNPDEWYFSPEHASGSDIVRFPDELVEKVSYYLSGASVAQNLQQARDRSVQKWCQTVDGNLTRTMVEHINNLLSNSSHSGSNDVDLASNWKQRIYYHFLTFGDHIVHDARVYGLMNTLTKNYVDKLGRFDINFHKRDIIEWKQRLSLLPGLN